jgi:phage gp46-like protein
MAISSSPLGTDLQLLHNLESQTDRDPPRDLRVQATLHPPLDPTQDLSTLAGPRNLQQALLLRLLTPVGELAPLGHATYGSRLFELVGELNSDRTRNRAKLFVLQALGAEPRVQSVQSVTVTPNLAQPTRIDIAVSLTPTDSATPLNLVFPFFLEGGLP